MSWVHRVHPSGTPPLHQVQSAARNIAHQAGIAPSKTRIIFQTVADCTLLFTVAVSGVLAAVHLYKSLFPRHKEDHATPEPAGGNRSPPRRPRPRATAAADDRGDYEKDGVRFR